MTRKYDVEGLRRLQEELASRVERTDRIGRVRRVAATDLSAGMFSTTVWASVAVFSFPRLELIETVHVRCRAPLPYLPGFLGFREVPPLVEAFRRLSRLPDLVLADGHGLAHPRRFGLACHLGVALDLPAIGCAKSRFVGEPAGELGPEAGSSVELRDGGEVLGRVLRSRKGCNPLWVSTGHRVSLDTAVDWVLKVGGPYRIPLPLREAHVQSNLARRGLAESVEVEASLPFPVLL